MLVVMAGMRRVAVPIMHVVSVIAVLNRLVSAGVTVAVVAVLLMFAVSAALALIPVGFVLAVGLAIMQVISVALVLNRGVAALCVMLMPGVSGEFVM